MGCARRGGAERPAARRDWKKAFVDAFGVAPEVFHRDFEAYRATL